MKEQSITFKTAKLAKEMKFNELCDYFYEGNTLSKVYKPAKNSNDSTEYAAPTQSLLQKWLREKHNIHLVPLISSTTGLYGYEIIQFYTNKLSEHRNVIHPYTTYEEAFEDGLQETLKLIK